MNHAPQARASAEPTGRHPMSSTEATREQDRENMLGFAVGLVGLTALVLTVLAYLVPNVAGVLQVAAVWLIRAAVCIGIPAYFLTRGDW